MSNKGQSMIGFLFFVVAFIFVWAIFLSKFLTSIGEILLETSGATGILAFVYANLNLGVLIGLILLILIGGLASTQ
jgi:hypothetical protein